MACNTLVEKLKTFLKGDNNFYLNQEFLKDAGHHVMKVAIMNVLTELETNLSIGNVNDLAYLNEKLSSLHEIVKGLKEINCDYFRQKYPLHIDGLIKEKYDLIHDKLTNPVVADSSVNLLNQELSSEKIVSQIIHNLEKFYSDIIESSNFMKKKEEQSNGDSIKNLSSSISSYDSSSSMQNNKKLIRIFPKEDLNDNKLVEQFQIDLSTKELRDLKIQHLECISELQEKIQKLDNILDSISRLGTHDEHLKLLEHLSSLKAIFVEDQTKFMEKMEKNSNMIGLAINRLASSKYEEKLNDICNHVNNLENKINRNHKIISVGLVSLGMLSIILYILSK